MPARYTDQLSRMLTCVCNGVGLGWGVGVGSIGAPAGVNMLNGPDGTPHSLPAHIPTRTFITFFKSIHNSRAFKCSDVPLTYSVDKSFFSLLPDMTDPRWPVNWDEVLCVSA